MHVTQPLASNADVSAKTPDLEKVEIADEKILAAKDKKKEQAERAGLRNPAGSAQGSKSRLSGKRPEGSVATGRPPKQSRRAREVLVVDLDFGETIPTPTPIRSVYPSGSAEEEGGVVMLRVLRHVYFSYYYIVINIFVSVVFIQGFFYLR